LSHGSVGDDDAVSWIEEVASTGSATNTLGGGSSANTAPGGTTETPNHTTTLSPAEVRKTRSAIFPLFGQVYLFYKRVCTTSCL
jgi:hypothetical protein